MKSKFSMALLAAGLLLPLSLNVFAEDSRPNDGRPPRGEFDRRGGREFRDGGPGRPPAKMHLNRSWRDIGELEKSKTPLSKAQAKQVVAIVLPWSKKKTMTESEAEKLEQKLSGVLTQAQLTTLEKGRPRGPRYGRGPDGGLNGDGPRGGGPRDGGPRGDGPPRGDGRRGDGPPPEFGRGGPDREGGPGRGEGRRFGGQNDSTRQLMRTWMESVNPFYAPTGNSNWKKLPAQFQQDAAKRYRESRATLEALSRKSKS